MNKKKNTRFFDFLRIEDYNVANIKSQKNKEKEGNEQRSERDVIKRFRIQQDFMEKQLL